MVGRGITLLREDVAGSSVLLQGQVLFHDPLLAGKGVGKVPQLADFILFFSGAG